MGYDDENGGLLRLRGKVSEKEKVLWFSYRDKKKFCFLLFFIRILIDRQFLHR